MNELIEGKAVTVRKWECKNTESGVVKKIFGKLSIAVVRNNKQIVLTQGVLELYDVRYV